MFQIKDEVSITASMINWMKTATKKVSDFNIGSIVRTMLEAAAIELGELYQQMFIGLREAIPVSVYNSFNFGLLPANSASGITTVTITASATDEVIPAATKFSTPGKQVTYSSTQDVIITAGFTVASVPVVASAPGVVGNLIAGSVFTLNPSPAGLVSATNLASFVNGADVETQDQRKLRFNSYIASLNRGTVAAIQYGLKTVSLSDALGNIIERVIYTSIVEPWKTDNTQPIALVNAYIHNGSGSTSDALLAKAQQVIYGYTDTGGNKVPGWSAAGVQVNIFKASEQTLNVVGAITPLAGFLLDDLVTAGMSAIRNYISGLSTGESAIKSEMIRLVKSIPGVYDFTISTPGDVTSVAGSVKLIPGYVALNNRTMTPTGAALAITPKTPVRTP